MWHFIVHILMSVVLLILWYKMRSYRSLWLQGMSRPVTGVINSVLIPKEKI